MPDQDIAVLLYGNGADLGNFRFFADDTATELIRLKKFDKSTIVITQTMDRASFVAAIKAIPLGQRIKELHVYSHSIGAGLYVGYHEATAAAHRLAAMNLSSGSGTKITYDQVLNAETGGILTDHLIRDPMESDHAILKAKFAPGAMMKLWGCNSGVSGWLYSDRNTPTNSYVTAQDAPADVYYWRALNTQNVPKPSIAQAFADFFGVTVYGAGSGSHIEVQHGGNWITSTKYKEVTGRYAGEPETLRLHPDAGDYNGFSPSSGP
jgi:hypothetical protein